MKKSTADHYNRLARMTPEERDEAIVREMLGPLFTSVFPMLAKPNAPEPMEDDQ